MNVISSLIISTSSISKVNSFFNSWINSSTNISGAEAPEETPIVLQLAILSIGTLLSEWINSDLSHPLFFATATNLTELEEFIQELKKKFIIEIEEVDIIKEDMTFKIPGKLN